MVKFVILIFSVLCFTVSAEDKAVDMSDPTAVYSSVGGVVNEDGDIDLSVGAAWGNNLLSIESKQNFDAVNVRYAYMKLWKGLGIYVDSTYQIEADQGSSIGAGIIYSLPVNKVFQIYPVVTLGGMELIEGEWIATATFGAYARFQLGNGFSVGLDPFYTTGEDSFSITSLDSFLAYQYKTQQVRLGFIGSEVNKADFDGSAYIKYKYAF